MTDLANGGQTRRSYDAIIIGSGMGGSAVALRLALAGRKVALIERGKWFPRGAPGARNPFIFDLQAPEDDFEIVSGRSKFYGAALYRFRERDFEAREFEAGISPAWPISYRDLEPYYEEAETLYRVHGAPDGDATDPPRRAPYPHPPLPHDPLIAEISQRLAHKGIPVAAIPRGIDYGPGRPCILCADCSGHFCARDAKMDSELATLRPALATGNVDLIAETRCEQILTDPSGRRVEGVLLRQGSEDIRLLAPVIIASAGDTHTPALLRRSASAAHPEGLGNQGGWLGRGVAAHSTGTMFPLVSALDMGARHTNTAAINAWFDGDPDGGWPYPLGVAQIAGQTPFWGLTSRLKRPVVRAVAKRSLNVFHMTEALPDKDTGIHFEGDSPAGFTPPRLQPGSYERLKKKIAKAFRAAGYPVITPNRDVALWHMTGGAVMGEDPASAVTDHTGRVHGIEGLYVADSTVLPSASAVNTGLTIVALALRTADFILQN